MNEKIIPQLRTDIKGERYNEDGKEFLLLSDPFGYAMQPVSLPYEFSGYLNFLNGKTNVEEIRIELEADYTNEDIDDFLKSLKELQDFLDYMGYLDTPRFNWMKQDVDNYLASSVRPPYCAGSSYTENRDELVRELHQIFSSVKVDDIRSGAGLVIVPHIDFRIGEKAHKCYSSGYHALRDSEPDLVVIFGTSHYGSSKRFILTEKNFETPLGIAVNATDVIDSLRDVMTDEDEVVIDDIAHRNEHSIEFQVLLSQYYFSNPNIRILPLLVNTFGKDISSKSLPTDDNGFNRFIIALKDSIAQLGYNPVYIASVDLAHIGRKFGDDFDATDMLENLRFEDNKLIHHLASMNADDFFTEVADVQDKNKICGLSPVYTALQYYKPIACRLLNYDIWHEEESRSAVSFASLAYYK